MKVSTDCGDYVTNEQTFGVGAKALSVTGNVTLNAASTAFPCGTIARFYYQLHPEISSFALNDSGSIPIPMSQSGIAWPSDIGRHVNPSDLNLAGFSVTDERWLVWFRPAARSDFYKLDGIINQDVPAGTYTLTLDNSNFFITQKLMPLSDKNGLVSASPILSVTETSFWVSPFWPWELDVSFYLLSFLQNGWLRREIGKNSNDDYELFFSYKLQLYFD